MRRRLLRLPPILLSLLLVPGAAGAASVKIWVSDTAADFSTGEARGVSVSADGSLLPGKSLMRVEGVNEAVLFTAVRDKSGELYVGTGDAGKILRITPEGLMIGEFTKPASPQSPMRSFANSDEEVFNYFLCVPEDQLAAPMSKMPATDSDDADKECSPIS